MYVLLKNGNSRTLRSRISAAPRFFFFLKNFRLPRSYYDPPFMNFPVFSEENNIFITRFEMFSIVFMGLIFQLSIHQFIFLNLKNLFSHCFRTIFPFHNLQLCSYIGKFWYIYVIVIKINKKSPCLFQPPGLLYFTDFSHPRLSRPPPLPSFIRDLRGLTVYQIFWNFKLFLVKHVLTI